MSAMGSSLAAIVTGALLALIAIFGGTSALEPNPVANDRPVVNYDGQ